MDNFSLHLAPGGEHSSVANEILPDAHSSSGHSATGHGGNHVGYYCDGHMNKSHTFFFPILNESSWPVELRIFLYFVGILFTFNGINHAVDVFMGAIDKITSHTIRIPIRDAGPNEPQYREVAVWHETVATLTLGACGTCSPEILLTIIEIIGNKFEAGDLGPGTIIGSAAFNLMVTTGICISSVPYPQIRRIEALRVYIVTTLVSIFAYGWLIVILAVSSPAVIEVWEAVVTLCMFPVLVVLAYLSEKNFCCRNRVDDREELDAEQQLSLEGFERRSLSARNGSVVGQLVLGGLHQHEASEMLKNATAKEVAEWTAKRIEDSKPRTNAYYRHAKLRPPTPSKTATKKQSANTTWVEFATSKFAVKETDGKVELKVIRKGNLFRQDVVKFETVEGTATAGEDFVANSGLVTFEPGETKKSLLILLIPSDVPEADEVFYVRLNLADSSRPYLKLGESNPVEITLIGDVKTSMIELKDRRLIVKDSADFVRIFVQRKGDVADQCGVKWITKEVTARPGFDYMAAEGHLIFQPGEVEQTVDVTIKQTFEANRNCQFNFLLTDVTGGDVVLGDKRFLVVTIISDEELQQKLFEAETLVNGLLTDNLTWTEAWKRQFVKAMNVNDGDVENATFLDYVLHAVSFGWKLILAFVPPPELFGGYLTFFIALTCVGALTAIMSDLAQMFGCLCQMDEVVTAAALVSVGTNLPDVFASRFAAITDKVADHAIGHITGSNSVNVFLGLGIPWVIASVYWNLKGKEFSIDSTDLGWCVMTYTVLSVISVAILFLRRSLKLFGQAELGGPKPLKYGTTLVLFLMWAGYLGFTYYQAHNHLPSLIHIHKGG